MPMYACTDGHATEYIEMSSAAKAAQHYVNDGDWGAIESTTWIDIWVTNEDDETAEQHEQFSVPLHPESPPCQEEVHDWKTPYVVVGGIKENPGVMGGTNGGFFIKEVCKHCGWYKHTQTRPQRPDTGETMDESIRFETADSASERWVENLRDDE